MLEQEYIKSLLHYNHDTGLLVWKFREREAFKTNRGFATWNARYAGEYAGGYHGGYNYVSINKKRYAAHQLIWIYVTGSQAQEIDHINHIRDDNRMANLRSVSRKENGRNISKRVTNKSGVTGVSWNVHAGKWAATIRSDGNPSHLGYFSVFEDAVLARKEAEKTNGYHCNHGSINSNPYTKQTTTG